MHRALVAFIAAVVAGCAISWGPLAVVRGGSGDLALASGVLVITDRCTFLESRGGRTLLVWPEDRTSWNPLTGAISFRRGDGPAIELRNGQPIAVGGGGSSQAEDGLAGDAWAARIDWASRPAPECLVESRWSVSDVVLDQVVT